MATGQTSAGCRAVGRESAGQRQYLIQR
jgi:hypothetical protein